MVFIYRHDTPPNFGSRLTHCQTRRAGMLETLNQDYIRTVRAKGVSFVWFYMPLRWLLPVVPSLARFRGLISGSFIIESIFFIPAWVVLTARSTITQWYLAQFFSRLFDHNCNLVVDIIQAVLIPNRETMSEGSKILSYSKIPKALPLAGCMDKILANRLATLSLFFHFHCHTHNHRS